MLRKLIARGSHVSNCKILLEQVLDIRIILSI